MSNRELSLIQIRTGKQRNVPNALELGEMALTTDEGRMFVGLPSTVIPVSPVSGRTPYSVDSCTGENVEVITEFTPSSVVNRVLSKAVKSTIPIDNQGSFTIQSASRMQLTIFAYTNAALVQGTAITDKNANIDVVYSYINEITTVSTTYIDSEGLTNKTTNNVVNLISVSTSNGNTTFVLGNNSGLPLTIEYTYRAWDDSLETTSSTLSNYTPTTP